MSMNEQTELEKVMAEHGLSYSEAKKYLAGLDHMAKTENSTDILPQDAGEPPKGAKW